VRYLKNKNYEKYLIDKAAIRKTIKSMRRWKDNSPIALLDATYKVASFFHSYYKCFQERSAKRLVILQNVKKNPTEDALKSYAIWKIIRAISIAEMQDMYDILNVNLTVDDIRGESFYSGIPQPTEQDLELGRAIRKAFGDMRERMEELEEELEKDMSEEELEIAYTETKTGPDGVAFKFCHTIISNSGDYVYFRR
jgi:arginyl-tRNA synthetase